VPSSSRVAVASEVGLVRTRNEDSAYVGRWLCAVADGMGGHAAGDVASATVIDALRSFDAETDTAHLTTILGSAVRAANAALTTRTAGDQAVTGMGSTLTALLWSGSQVAVAHIGDSRAYLLRGGRLTLLTEDHVVSNLVASPMPARISGYLVRFLDARPGWSPDLTLRTALPGDRYLLCSDGLCGFVEPEEIRQALANVEADEAAHALIALAYAAGAPDNVTVIVTDVPDGHWAQREGTPILVGAAADLPAQALASFYRATCFWPWPGRRLIAVELVHRFYPVARNDVLGHFHRVAVTRGAADPNDLQHRHGHRDLQFGCLSLGGQPRPVILHP
jgi:serine/threonine protein phosphatase PrpC